MDTSWPQSCHLCPAPACDKHARALICYLNAESVDLPSPGVPDIVPFTLDTHCMLHALFRLVPEVAEVRLQLLASFSVLAAL